MKNKRLIAIVGVLAAMLLAIPVFANAKDRNNDRIPDRWEKSHKLSLNVNQARRDQDHDGLVNKCEFQLGDNPRDPDTNNDGTNDEQDADVQEADEDADVQEADGQNNECGPDELDGENNDTSPGGQHG